jgi:hypothetical protein
MSNSSNVNPTVAPATCRMLALKPCCAPSLSATTLTGPGEIDEASANAAMESKTVI